MGALTLKSFPFELRGWELEKFNYVDLTDSFGSNLKVSLNNKQIIQIESCDSKHSNWIHDKARQFFDGLINNNKNLNNLPSAVKNLHKILYLFELCNFKYLFLNYFIIIYENLSINNLCLLNIYGQKYSFIKIKKSETVNFNNNLETNFLLNSQLNKTKLSVSTLCLLISNNIRFEGSILNLNLKQRLLKGNFKLFNIGSFVNLTFNIKFLGKTSIKILKSIVEGKNFICQDLKFAKNPLLIINSELLKKNQNLIKLFLFLNNKINFNILNSTVFEISSYFINKQKIITNIDFLKFSSIYFINLTTYSNSIFNKILKINILFLNKFTRPLIKKLYLDQNFLKNNNFKKSNVKYIYLPVKTFFETKEKFLNNNGLIKNTNLLISNVNNINSNWKTIRNIFNVLNKNNNNFINIKTNFKINLNFKNLKLKIFNYLVYEANKNLNINKFTINNINHYFIKEKIILLKYKRIKFVNIKMKLWLNDFFTGGKDGFCKNSLFMIKLSKINRLQFNNFF